MEEEKNSGGNVTIIIVVCSVIGLLVIATIVYFIAKYRMKRTLDFTVGV